MKRGTRSLLFGVHQFVWHPLTVSLAWRELYGRPTWRELVCIVIHDWGYWGCETMDGEDGSNHPAAGARLAHRLCDGKLVMADRNDYYNLVVFHSRHYARLAGREPSKLCYADKLSIKYDPWWLYLPRAWLSGELFEYRALAARWIDIRLPHRLWFAWVKAKFIKIATEQRGDAVEYMPGVSE